MPRIPRIEDDTNENEIDTWDEFTSGWKRSRRGNLWRLYDGKTLTIFCRDDEYYGWCVADGKQTRFSAGGFEMEEDAMDNLAETLGVGDW